MRVFILQHTRDFPDGTEDVKVIGVYSSEQGGRAAMSALSSLPGFCEYPSGFAQFGEGLVYVSRGVGTVELPIRSFAPPDILLLDVLTAPTGCERA